MTCLDALFFFQIFNIKYSYKHENINKYKNNSKYVGWRVGGLVYAVVGIIMYRRLTWNSPCKDERTAPKTGLPNYPEPENWGIEAGLLLTAAGIVEGSSEHAEHSIVLFCENIGC